mmetsp:Transcript_9319/g.23132  ORF Transcript_9319/g.23132 Transcript_9319/m.23132 type:complete len:257 (+) Transcript_9319:333-1103(+)
MAAKAAAKGAARASTRPTHFLALPLNTFNPLHAFVAKAHEGILRHCPDLKGTLVEPHAAHITLGVLSLPSEERVSACCADLRQWIEGEGRAVVREDIRLRLAGVRQFKSGVLYLAASTTATESGDAAGCPLAEMHASLSRHLHLKGYLPEEPKQGGYTPHCTIAKFSKLRLPRRPKKGEEGEVGGAGGPPRSKWAKRRARKNRKFPRECYEEVVDEVVGEVSLGVSHLQLCAMGGRKKGEYYQVLFPSQTDQEELS